MNTVEDEQADYGLDDIYSNRNGIVWNSLLGNASEQQYVAGLGFYQRSPLTANGAGSKLTAPNTVQYISQTEPRALTTTLTY